MLTVFRGKSIFERKYYLGRGLGLSQDEYLFEYRFERMTVDRLRTNTMFEYCFERTTVDGLRTDTVVEYRFKRTTLDGLRTSTM